MNDHLQRVFRTKLAELRSTYLRQVGETAEELSTLSLELGSTVEAPALRKIHRLAHSLAGSAPTFGFHAMGQSARELEQLLAPHMSGSELVPIDVGEILDGVAEVCSAARKAARGQSDERMAASRAAADDAQSRSRGPW